MSLSENIPAPAQTPPEGSLEALMALQRSVEAEIRRLGDFPEALLSKKFQHLNPADLATTYKVLAGKNHICAMLVSSTREGIEMLQQMGRARSQERSGL